VLYNLIELLDSVITQRKLREN